MKAAGYRDQARNVFLCRNTPINNFLKQLGEGEAGPLLTTLLIPFAMRFCLFLDDP